METYRLAYTDGADITIFDAADNAEALSLADDFDKRHGSSATTLWVRQSDGSWAAVERTH
jgi:hypothetical protein